jgi:hypothetical protein
VCSESLIPVYRKHQPAFISPCILGEPCPTCALHKLCQAGHPCGACRQGEQYDCERSSPALPAFVVRFAGAMQLVRDGAAVFIHKNTALQLTIDKLAQLRGLSCKVNQLTMFEYAAGSGFIRTAINMGWGYSVPVLTISAVEDSKKSPLPAATKAYDKAKT